MVFMGMVLATQAQVLKASRPFGTKGLYEIAPTNDTITVTPVYTASVYTMSVDTSITIQVDVSKSNSCNQLWFEITGDATKRYVNFSTGFKGAATDSIAANRSRTWGFVYIGSKYVLMRGSADY